MKRTLASLTVAATALVSMAVLATPAEATTCGFVKYQDGTVGPIICGNGSPNMKVEKALKKASPKVMALKASSTRKKIQAAVCADSKAGTTGAELYDALEYQAANYDWSRSVMHPVEKRLIQDRYC